VTHRRYLLLLIDPSNGVKVRQTMNLPYPELKKLKVAIEEMEKPNINNIKYYKLKVFLNSTSVMHILALSINTVISGIHRDF
jgi:hypothetical protein